ncbi:hypothetical protein B0H13DRAFT_2269217 [Mycena leptocephala]|nr:hypothetical protein B0H13DRAFT_2269217 [Mycena leptocephala]
MQVGSTTPYPEISTASVGDDGHCAQANPATSDRVRQDVLAAIEWRKMQCRYAKRMGGVLESIGNNERGDDGRTPEQQQRDAALQKQRQERKNASEFRSRNPISFSVSLLSSRKMGKGHWAGGPAKIPQGASACPGSDTDPEAELDSPFGIKCCRHGRFEMSANQSLYKRGNRLTTMIEIGCPPHSSPSLALASLTESPLCAPRPTAAMLPPSPFPTHASTPPRCHRPLAMAHATLTSPSFSCGRLFYRSSVAPLDIHVEAILMRIAQLCATFPLTLRRYDRLVLFVHDDFWHCLRMA